MPQPLLEGEYEEVPERSPSDDLLDRIARLEDKVAEMRQSIQREAVVLVLNVLAQAMRDVAAGKYKIDAPTSLPPSESKWDTIKQRLEPRLRPCIDLLISQPRMKRTQIAAALRMDYSNCAKNVIGVLLRQGLIVDNGGEISLKEL